MSWNTFDPSLVLVSTMGGHVHLLKISENRKSLEKITSYKHPKRVFGVRWSPHEPNTFASCCQDAMLRVYDKDATEPKKIFGGHKAKIFTCVWNPLIANIMATSSDDKTVIVWDISKPTDQAILKVLKGHTQNVRGLLWNTEIPYILLSGSWDASIILWDV